MPIPFDITILIPFIVLAVWIYMLGKTSKSNLIAGLFIVSVGYFLYDEFSEAPTLALGFRDSFWGMILLSGLSLFLSALKKNKKYYWVSTIAIALLTLYMNGAFDKKDKALTQNEQTSQSAEIILSLTGNPTLEEAQSIFRELPITLKSTDINIDSPLASSLDNAFIVDIAESADDYIVFDRISKHQAVEWIEWNELISLPSAASSTLSSASSFNDPESTSQWALEPFDFKAIHNQLETIKPQRKAVIAILDTGVDTKHEDLGSIIHNNIKSQDKNGHGTHCAGIAGAVANNGVGISSLNHKGNFVEILPIPVLSASGRGTQVTILRGILEAADMGADVISLSLGGPSMGDRQEAYTDAVKYAQSKGAIVVVAAGNSNKNARDYSPANVEGVITVAAINSGMKKAYFSNIGPNLKKMIAAPGESIHSTFPRNRYKSFNGTSMATPFVAGTIGVLKSIQPDLDTEQVYELLSQTGRNHAKVKDIGYIIDPKQALNSVLD